MDKTIPQQLDEPLKIILWTLDELAVLLVPFIACLCLFNSPVTGLVSGIIALVVLKKLKGEQGHYFLFRLWYWHLGSFGFQRTPPAYQREWIG